MPDLSDPFVAFAESFGAQAAGYFAVVGLAYVVFWKWGARRLAHRRIQPTVRFDRRQLLFEVRHSLVTLFGGTAMAFGVAALDAAGWTRLTSDASSIGWPAIAATFVLLLILNDAWFYACHRLLHHPRLFAHVHAIHHRSIDVSPFSSYSMHVVEGLLLGAWIVPVVCLVPIYLPMLGALQAVGLLNNVMSHLGYELLPRGLVRVPLLRFVNTSTFHNLHHTTSRGNYGLMTRVWDRLFGTEIPSYERRFTERESRATRASVTS